MCRNVRLLMKSGGDGLTKRNFDEISEIGGHPSSMVQIIISIRLIFGELCHPIFAFQHPELDLCVF